MAVSKRAAVDSGKLYEEEFRRHAMNENTDKLLKRDLIEILAYQGFMEEDFTKQACHYSLNLNFTRRSRYYIFLIGT